MTALAIALVITGLQTPAASAPAFVLTPEIRRETLKALRSELEARYVEEATAKKISADLTKRESAGEFDKITSGPEFASRINDLMKSMVTDAHLRFRFSEKPLPIRQRPSEPSADEIKRA